MWTSCVVCARRIAAIGSAGLLVWRLWVNRRRAGIRAVKPPWSVSTRSQTSPADMSDCVMQLRWLLCAETCRMEKYLGSARCAGLTAGCFDTEREKLASPFVRLERRGMASRRDPTCAKMHCEGKRYPWSLGAQRGDFPFRTTRATFAFF